MNIALRQLLASGCDERTEIDETTGRNKYHLDPFDTEGLLYRGSCTSGALTPFSTKIAEEFVQEAEASDFNDIIENHRNRLSSLIAPGEKDEFEIFFAPSGSDLMYIPLLLSRVLNPKKPILNLVSCPEELGSGSVIAANGKFYNTRNQFGDVVIPNKKLFDSPEISTTTFTARANCGSISDRRDQIAAAIESHQNTAIISNLVYGSKSGIKDHLDVIYDFPDDVMWVVDLCQLRAEPSLIHTLLGLNALILITGSKFYQSPPFCGAMLVPNHWIDKAAQTSGNEAAAFNTIFSSHDIPDALPNIRKHFPDTSNLGQACRWEIAISEMEMYAKWPRKQTNRAIVKWNNSVTKALEAKSCIELMPDQNKTNPSIISFRLKKNDQYLDHEQLRDLFKLICTTEFGPNRPFDKVFIGQPVKYIDGSFLRVAIGSYRVRQFLEQGTFEFEDDIHLIDVIAKAVDGKLF